MEILGTLIGLLYLYYEYRASRWLWPLGIIMPAVYLYVYYAAGLYADFGINVYYILAGVYGWWAWTRKGLSERAEVPVARTPLSAYPFLVLAAALAFFAIAAVLLFFTDSTVPFWDAFTTALSIVALWMLARRWAEQWVVWIWVDAVSAGLYIYKDLYFTAALYGLYAIIAVAGYRKWCVMARETKKN